MIPPAPVFCDSRQARSSDSPEARLRAQLLLILGMGDGIAEALTLGKTNNLPPSRVHLYAFHGSPVSVWGISYLVSLTRRQSPPLTLEASSHSPILLCSCSAGM